ncbi:MAG: HupE/UreJ family protein [Deltaproteobacteria bacterium]|nr:HupE/UreJ family protein [Deltaproteobacteria bacterium]
MKKVFIPLLTILAFLLIPQIASAHAPIKGINNFYNGIIHPLVVPAHLLGIIALGLLTGQQSKNITLAPRFFMGAILAGLLILSIGFNHDTETLVMLTGLTAALITVISPKLKTILLALIAILIGFFTGLDSSPESLTGQDLFMSLGGTFLGASLTLFYISLLVSKAKRKWQQIGIRVTASWVFASILLVMTLNLVKQ